MDPEAVTGRGWVVSVIAVEVVWWVIASLVRAAGSHPSFGGFVWVLIYVGISIFLFRGANWARLLVGVVSMLLFLFAAFAALWDTSTGGITGLSLYWGGAALVCLYAGLVLLGVPAVRRYFGVKKAESTG